MFTCSGFRYVGGYPRDITASFCEDGSVRQASENGAWLMLGSWSWKHEECCVEVWIPGPRVELLLGDAVEKYLKSLGKLVLS